MRTAAIVNPQSRGGKTGGEWPDIREKLVRRLGPIETRFTERCGHGSGLARALLEEGFDRIIAAGGDGTINEIVNGFFVDDRPVRPGACLGILPLGTGGDFVRTLAVSRKLDAAIELLAAAVPESIDVGKVSFRAWDGKRQSRYFSNLVSFGMGGEVASRSRNILSPLGGQAAFLYATAAAFFIYHAKRVSLKLDGSAQGPEFEIYNIAVGNGKYHGGGMNVCPTAELTDGVFEITVVEYLNRWEAIRDLPILYSGKIYSHPKVKHLRASRILAESTEDVRIEVDGEPLGTLPLEITLLPRILPVLKA